VNLRRELERCVSLLEHINGTGWYPPDGDDEARSEIEEHIASGRRALDEAKD
jgi:hypothetical protein